MSMAPAGRVSVVIPTWNCERYIGQTLRSVLAQSVPAHEVIVVDDGSTDRTAEIVADFGPAVTLVRQANQGVCVARNRGLERSTGDFLCFLDHDDYWFSSKLAQQLQAFDRYPEAGVAFTRFALWQPVDGAFPAPESLAPHEKDAPNEEPEFTGWIYHQFLLDCWALTSTAMIRREALERWGAFDPLLPYSEDWDLWLRLSRQVPFVKLDSVSTLYRQHPEQGNRKVRSVDYRTVLIEQAVSRWGLSSRDGRAIEPSRYHSTLSRYHLQFALHHLQGGSRMLAMQSLWKSWRHRPMNLKLPMLAGAALLGWRPGTPAR